MSHEFKVVGKPLSRIEGPDIVTGKAIYCADLSPPNLLYARILRSPYPHAKITKIDLADAENVKGVAAFLTHKDVPRTSFNTSWRGPFHFGVLPADERILEDEVRFIGDKVVAVAAGDLESAEEALQLVRVDYEELPTVFDASIALSPNAPKVHANGNIAGSNSFQIGDVERAFKEADSIFENTYRTQRVQNLALEPHGSIAQYDAQAGRLTVWSSTQVPFCVRFVLSLALGMEEEKIRVIKPFVGGGFGSKDEVFDEAICALLSMKTGRPVKILYGRGEDLVASRSRHSTELILKTGVRKDGSIVARQMKAIFDTGAYATAGPSVMRASGMRWAALYPCGNIAYEGYAVYTNNPVSGAFRGYGNPQVNFATESQMDEIAEELGLDQLELRLKNVARKGDRYAATPYIIEALALDECLLRVAEEIGWKHKRVQRRPGHGIGIAVNIHTTGGKPVIPEKSSATVRLARNGTIEVLTGAVDLGQGANTVLTQIAAEELGCEIDMVRIHATDTGKVPFDFGAYASRTTTLSGNAVRLAAIDARKRILVAASELLKVSAEQLEIAKGEVTHLPSGLKARFAEIAKYTPDGSLLEGHATFEPPANAPSGCAVGVEVAVNEETGQIGLLKVVCAVDCGKVINPLLAEGQIHGSVMQGMGFAGIEELSVESGRVHNPDLAEYKVPMAHETPRIKVIFIESKEPNGPYGAKGLGETAIVSVAPAIANAVYNATHRRIRDLPILPEKLIKQGKEIV